MDSAVAPPPRPSVTDATYLANADLASDDAVNDTGLMFRDGDGKMVLSIAAYIADPETTGDHPIVTGFPSGSETDALSVIEVPAFAVMFESGVMTGKLLNAPENSKALLNAFPKFNLPPVEVIFNRESVMAS